MNWKIDLNCDMGESHEDKSVEHEKDIFPYITSCNIACGFHAGDPLHIKKTIALAIQHNVQIGAHPSYPDRANFGRKAMNLSADELQACIEYQVGALKALVQAQNSKLKYVKPHGALYNKMAVNKDEATAVIKAIQSIDPSLALMGLAGSDLESWAKKFGIRFIAEAFMDRSYQSNGQLTPRSEEGAVLHEAKDYLNQTLSIIQKGEITAKSGELISLKAQSLCVHGDNPSAIEILETLKQAFAENGIKKQAFKC